MRTCLIGVLTTVALLLAGCTGLAGEDDQPTPAEAAASASGEFWQAWAEGDLRAAAAVTDRPGQVVDLIESVTSELRIEQTSYRFPGKATCTQQRCTQPVRVTHELAGAGPWTYDTTTTLERGPDGAYVVRWRASTVHPRLTSDTRLERARELPPRASVLDRDGERLTTNRQVVKVGVVPRKVRDRSYAALGRLLEVDTGALREKVEAAEPDWFVPVITLREPDYRPIAEELLSVPGVAVDSDTWSLTPSSTWGRALIGTVGPATEETLEAAGPTASSADVVGASGLQLAFQQQLAGSPGISVELVDAETGQELDTLLRVRAARGTPLRTTLDRGLQEAAETAVQQATKLTALVAVQAGTGEVLASAVGPGIQSYNTAFVGQYPPGSTFKVVSTAALLEQDVVEPEDPTACPPTTSVGGRSFKNYDDFEPLPAGSTFSDAFAASCNTAIVSLAPALDDDALHDIATGFGIGADWDLGVSAYSGEVPVTESLVDRAASMIGQGRVLASPLTMATAAAAVSSGEPHAPSLVPAAGSDPADPEALPDDVVGPLRAMMRQTVESGTATSLDLGGAPVSAKTGTAEYDSDDPTKTHAWMIGFRGDVAFAVLVDDGESGSTDAAPVVRTFLEQAGR